MNATVRTRFAPSPTGYLHIGGARTALFNYLLARRLGGTFALRIEDTDQTRNIASADARLLDDLRWLGLHWDEGPGVGGPGAPYHQSQRLAIYQEHARRLLEAGHAYYAFDTREQLDALRAEAARAKRTFRYPRPKAFPSEADAQKAREAGRPVVVRLKMPEHDYVVNDAILGEVRLAASEVDDFVLLKADGWPTYHFAVVVDDELMGVTHVLRGQEHTLNTVNHIGLQERLVFRTPVYAHLPIILNMDGSKMSKREKDKAVRAAADAALAAGALELGRAAELAGCSELAVFEAWRRGDMQLDSEGLARLARALGVHMPEIQIHDFRASGYLPEVVLNFIALLGWSPGDDREKMTLDEMCRLFSLERIGRTNARFDRQKLLNFNTTALAAASPERLLAAMKDYLSANGDSPLARLGDELLSRLLSINDGKRLLRDVDEKSAALFVRDDQVRYDAEAVSKVLFKGDAAGLAVLREMRGAIAAQADWSPAALEQFIRSFGEQRQMGLGKVAQPLRVAVTGTTVSPPIFETLAILGRERTLARIDRCLVQPRGGV